MHALLPLIIFCACSVDFFVLAMYCSFSSYCQSASVLSVNLSRVCVSKLLCCEKLAHSSSAVLTAQAPDPVDSLTTCLPDKSGTNMYNFVISELLTSPFFKVYKLSSIAPAAMKHQRCEPSAGVYLD